MGERPKMGPPFKRGKNNPSVEVRRMFFWRKVAKEIGPVVTRAEASRMLGVSHNTIMRRINAGTYRACRYDQDKDSAWWVSLADVMQDAEECVLESGSFSDKNTPNR